MTWAACRTWGRSVTRKMSPSSMNHGKAASMSSAAHWAHGKSGVIHQDHGIYVFPDTIVAGTGEKPQHVYSVRFEARELWGPQASPRHAVYLDLWDDYLDHV